MGKVVLVSGDLLDASKKMGDASARIENALKEVDSIMGEVDGIWGGKLAKDYLRRYEELKENFPQFKTAVSSYGLFLKNVVDVYRKEFTEKTETSING